MIGIVDYGAGNLHSVQKAFEYLGKNCTILRDPGDLGKVARVVLPGVGSFGHALKEIQKKKWFAPLRDWLDEDRPFLGICLGMQLLFESSDESPGVRGFSLVKGTCRKFTERKVPQIGWNEIHIKRNGPLFTGLVSGSYFYFVHSFYAAPEDGEATCAETFYGSFFVSIVGKGRVFGVQFHPEKSGNKGLRLLQNWVERC
jgi:glutamine amidotransferase